MFLISHRGNLNGKNILLENNPNQIKKVLKLGYHCEIDVWYKNNNFFLGHDFPQHKIDKKFLFNLNLWCHAKNIQALLEMQKLKAIHFFWHENDKVTLTSKGYLWAYPSKKIIKNSIILFPEKYNILPKKCLGICSDNIFDYKKYDY